MVSGWVSTPMPTNQAEQNVVFQPLHRSIRSRSERTEYNACNGIACSRFSGGIDGRPIGE
ncbi:hypothetical protein ACVWZZ_005945 [Bradyrhizobium sp. LM6.10]